MDKYETIESLIDNLNKDKYPHQTTQKKIIFRNEMEFGLTAKQFSKKMGEPSHIVKNSNIKGHRIFLYKIFIGEMKTRCEIHFFNNAFFLATYTFRNINEVDIEKLSNIIHEKYLTLNTKKSYNVFISDEEENIVLLNKELHSFSISYTNWKSQEFIQLQEKAIKIKKIRLFEEEERMKELKALL